MIEDKTVSNINPEQADANNENEQIQNSENVIVAKKDENTSEILSDIVDDLKQQITVAMSNQDEEKAKKAKEKAKDIKKKEKAKAKEKEKKKKEKAKEKAKAKKKKEQAKKKNKSKKKK